jgi:hypothetical protein
MDLYEELLGLVDALTRGGVDYAICGGIALAIHGHPRFTKDIDLLVRLEDVDAVLAAVATRGFDLLAAPMAFGAGTPQERHVRRVSKAEGAELLTLGLLIVSPALDEAWRGRGAVEWRGRRLRAVSASGLVHMKRLAGRDQDLLDVKKLEGRSGEG